MNKTDRVYDWIVGYMRESAGLPPTVREIRDGVGIKSTSTVAYQIKKLVDAGRITRRPGVYGRNIAIPEAFWGVLDKKEFSQEELDLYVRMSEDVANEVTAMVAMIGLHVTVAKLNQQLVDMREERDNLAKSLEWERAFKDGFRKDKDELQERIDKCLKHWDEAAADIPIEISDMFYSIEILRGEHDG